MDTPPPGIPDRYAGLAPFDAWFAGGVPMLAYAKVDWFKLEVLRPALYVGPRLFASHMAELKRAGYASVGIGDCLMAGAGRRIAITFDSGFRNVLRHALKPLARCGFTATAFLVAGRLGASNQWEVGEGEREERLMDEADVRAWLAAGHAIGAQSLSHPRLTRLPLAAARQEIIGAKKLLEDRFRVPVEHFCYPYGDWSEALAAVAAEAGYRTASTSDSGLNTPATPPHALRRIRAFAPRTTLNFLRSLPFFP